MVGAWVRGGSLSNAFILFLVGCHATADLEQDAGAEAADAPAEAVSSKPTDAGPSSKAAPELVATLPPHTVPTDLLVTSDFLYFAGAGSVQRADGRPCDVGFVHRVRRDGNSIEAVWTGPASTVKIVHAEHSLYVLPFDYPGRTGKLVRVAEDGTVSTIPGSTWNAHGSTVALTAAAFGPAWYYTTGSGGGSLVGLTSGGVATLAPVYPADEGMLAAVGDQLYWVSAGSTTLNTLAFSSPGQPAVALSGHGAISAISAAAQRLVVVAGTQLLTVVPGQESQVLVDSPLLRGTTSIREVGGRVYGARPGVGAVVLLEPSGTLKILASGQAAPTFVAANDTALFWINAGDHTVMRLLHP